MDGRTDGGIWYKLEMFISKNSEQIYLEEYGCDRYAFPLTNGSAQLGEIAHGLED